MRVCVFNRERKSTDTFFHLNKKKTCSTLWKFTNAIFRKPESRAIPRIFFHCVF